MASPPLRLDADVTSQGGRNRITIYFSHVTAAQDYENYLQALGASWKIVLKEEAGVEKEGGEDVDLKVSRKGKVLSMNLPSSVTVLQEDDGKFIALKFEDDNGAKTWDQKMLLWTGYPGNQQTLSRSLTLDAVRESLRSLNQYPQSSLWETTILEVQGNIASGPAIMINGPITNVFGVNGIFGPPVTQRVGPSRAFGGVFRSRDSKDGKYLFIDHRSPFSYIMSKLITGAASA